MFPYVSPIKHVWNIFWYKISCMLWPGKSHQIVYNSNMLSIKFQLHTSSDLRPQKIMGIRRVVTIHVEQCAQCGFDRQAKPKNFCALRQTLCISYLVWFFLSFQKTNQNTERKHKLRRSFSFSSQSTLTHTHTHIWSYPLRAVRIFICCFSSSRQVRNINREVAEEDISLAMETGRRKATSGICCWRRKVCHACIAPPPYAYLPLQSWLSLYFYQSSLSWIFS